MNYVASRTLVSVCPSDELSAYLALPLFFQLARRLSSRTASTPRQIEPKRIYISDYQMKEASYYIEPLPISKPDIETNSHDLSLDESL